MEKEMSQAVECNHCGKRFMITSTNVVSEKQFKCKDGQTIFLTYFDCPECKFRYWVQADNQITLGLKKECLDYFQKLARLKIAKQSIPNKQRNKFDKSRAKLSNRRLELMKQYDNTYVTDTETGEDVYVKFTVI